MMGMTSFEMQQVHCKCYWDTRVELKMEQVCCSAMIPGNGNVWALIARIGMYPILQEGTQITCTVKQLKMNMQQPAENAKMHLLVHNLSFTESKQSTSCVFESFALSVGIHKQDTYWPFVQMNILASVKKDNNKHEIHVTPKSTTISLGTVYTATTLERFCRFKFLIQQAMSSTKDSTTLQMKELVFSIVDHEKHLARLWNKYETSLGEVPAHDFTSLKGKMGNVVFHSNGNQQVSFSIDSLQLQECNTNESKQEFEILNFPASNVPCLALLGTQFNAKVTLQPLHIQVHNLLVGKLLSLFDALNMVVNNLDNASEAVMDVLNDIDEEKKQWVWIAESLYIECKFLNAKDTPALFSSDSIKLYGSNMNCKANIRSFGNEYTLQTDQLQVSIESANLKYTKVLSMNSPSISISRSKEEERKSLFASVSGKADLVISPLVISELMRMCNSLIGSIKDVDALDINYSLEYLHVNLQNQSLMKSDKNIRNFDAQLNSPVGNIKIECAPLSYNFDCRIVSLVLQEEGLDIVKTVANISTDSDSNAITIKYIPGQLETVETRANFSCLYWKYVPCLPENLWLNVFNSMFGYGFKLKHSFDIKCTHTVIDYIPKLLKSRMILSIDGMHTKGIMNETEMYKMKLNDLQLYVHPSCQVAFDALLNSALVSLSSGVVPILQDADFCKVLSSPSLGIEYQLCNNDAPKFVYNLFGGDIHYDLCFDSLCTFVPLMCHLLYQSDIDAELFARNEQELKNQAEKKKVQDEEAKKKFQESQSYWNRIATMFNPAPAEGEVALANAGALFQMGGSVASASKGIGIPAFPAPDMLPVTAIRIGKSDHEKKEKPVNIIIHCHVGSHYSKTAPTLYLDIELQQIGLEYCKYSEYDPKQFGFNLSIEHIIVKNVLQNTIVLQSQIPDKESPDANATLVYSAKVHHLQTFVLPLKLNFDYTSGCYMVELFQAVSDACALIPESGASIRFKNLYLNDVALRINYESSNITNFASLYQGNTSELAKFANLKDAPFSFSPVSFQETEVNSFSKVLQLVKSSFTNDLCSSKLVMLAFGTLPFTAVRVFSTGAYNFVAIPVNEMAKQDGSLFVGICKGFANATSNTLVALANLGKLAVQVPAILFKNVLIAQNATTTTTTDTTPATQDQTVTEYAMIVLPKDDNTTVTRTVITKIIGGVDAIDEQLSKIAKKFEKAAAQ